MKTMIYNIGYFLKEARITLKMNWISNLFSLFSTGLIFIIFGMIVSAWWISNEVVEKIQGEAEINVYYNDTIEDSAVLQLIEEMKSMEGVWEVRRVDEEEAHGRMEEILGKEARVLEFFDENPFEAFLEVKIHLEKMDSVLENINNISAIEYVRDNREVLDRLRSISDGLRVLGFLVVTAVGMSTLVIISHIIRMGINNNKDQINTLRLLGAPDIFIGFPFLIIGLFLTLGGGFLAAVLITFLLKSIYAQMAGPLPFIPLPSLEELQSIIVIILLSGSAVLGIVGSFIGLSSIRNN